MLEVIMGLLAAFDVSTFGDLLEAGNRYARLPGHNPIDAGWRVSGS